MVMDDKTRADDVFARRLAHEVQQENRAARRRGGLRAWVRARIIRWQMGRQATRPNVLADFLNAAGALIAATLVVSFIAGYGWGRLVSSRAVVLA